LNLHTRNLSLYCRVCTDCASCYTERAAFDSCPFSFVSGGAEVSIGRTGKYFELTFNFSTLLTTTRTKYLPR
jgi:hypothetical protein